MTTAAKRPIPGSMWYQCERAHAAGDPFMKLKIGQRSDEFFDLFAESASNLRMATELLQDLIEDYNDVEVKARRIQDREHEGDEITHGIVRRLNTTFITPMDREDIYALASALDEVLD